MRLLILDYPATRIGIRIALHGECDICAEAGTIDDAVRAAKREEPDLCLIGFDVPGGAIRAIRSLCEAAPDAAVVVLGGTAPDAEDMLAVIRAGAVGCVWGGAEQEALVRVVRAVAAGEAAVPRAMVLELVRQIQGANAGRDGLTAREAQILAMIRKHQSTAAIADRLGISPVTVRRHISALVQKTGVQNRGELAAQGRTAGS